MVVRNYDVVVAKIMRIVFQRVMISFRLCYIYTHVQRKYNMESCSDQEKYFLCPVKERTIYVPGSFRDLP